MKAPARFSLDPGVLERILREARPLGHHEDASTLNLGFGFMYYGLARALRPAHVVVVGSGFGFSVVCLALALRDNGFGRLSFVDPSYSVLRDGPLRTLGGTAQWDDPDAVRGRFEAFGVADVVTHYRTTSQEFFASWDQLDLPKIDMAFIDGNHSFESVRHDFVAAMRHARRNSYLFLHDTHLVIREMVGHSGVKRFLRIVQRDTECFEVVDFPFSSGVALVRSRRDGPWHPGA